MARQSSTLPLNVVSRSDLIGRREDYEEPKHHSSPQLLVQGGGGGSASSVYITPCTAPLQCAYHVAPEAWPVTAITWEPGARSTGSVQVYPEVGGLIETPSIVALSMTI